MLLIDSGNSAIKCRLLRSGMVSDHVFELYQADGWQGFEAFIDELDISKAYLASVATAETRQRLTDKIHRSGRIQVYPLTTLQQLGNIKNAYTRYQTLGVDRWLALLGASELSAHDAIVIDAGSAITIDLLSQRDGHLGGAILPGFHCDRARFERMFPAIDFTALPKAVEDVPGRSTQACLRPQAMPVSSEYIGQMIKKWRALLSEPVEILLCGQDANRVAAKLTTPHRIVPDLVFTGMLKQIACLG